MTQYDVVVLVCTYRRARQLTVLLDALTRLDQPDHDHRRVGVFVVDNSPDFEGRPVVEDFERRRDLQLHYVAHGAGNISSGRNAALRSAAGRARLVALIDDDEVPEPQWLNELVRVLQDAGADVATGPVLARYPHGTAEWLQADVLYSVVGPEDREVVEEAVSGNALLTDDCIRRLGLSFDESLGVSGGEDQLFFRTARAAGARLVYAARAVVHEDVPEDRLTVRYLMRREFRKGNTLGLLDRSRPGWPRGRKTRRLLAAFWWALSGLLQTARAGIRQDRTAALVGLLRILRAAGMLSGLAGRTYGLYRTAPR